MKFLFITILITLGCKPVDQGLVLSEAKLRSIESSKIHIPQENIAWWQQIAPKCNDEFPSKVHGDGRCDDGDATLFNGLLCATGFEESCEAVAKAQDNQGRWWRSPRQRDLPRKRNSFSRDQTMGVLLYLTQTKNTTAAEKWTTWMGENRKCFLKSPFSNSCALGATVTCDDSDDATCVLSPNIWSLMNNVWQHLGLDTSFRMRDPYSELGELKKILKLFDDEMPIARLSLLETEMSRLGYKLHLKGVQVLLKDKLEARTPETQLLANLLHNRQPENLFFRYLAKGPSQDLANHLVKRCPAPGRLPSERTQWAWERADKDQAWEKSIGWDCFFLGRLLVNKNPKVAAKEPE